MKLWEINAEIDALIDYETGEVADIDALENLKMKKHEKLRNIAFLALNQEAEIVALKEQIAKFTARKKAAKKTVAWAKELDGETMKETEFIVGYNPPSVEIEDIALLDRRFFRLPEIKRIEPVPDKKAIKAAIDAGQDVPGVRLVRTVKIK